METTERTKQKTTITVGTTIQAPVEKVWELWTDPSHIIRWCTASDDWHTPKAENDLRTGGRFLSRMEAVDGSMGFDFSGTYSKVEPHQQIEYTMDDGREVYVFFASNGNETTVTETFEAEKENSAEMQREGWQAILNNFKRYVETPGKFETLHFEIEINANVAKVYQTMLDEKKYLEWTAEFNPSSSDSSLPYIGSWEKGSKILFQGTDENGNVGGMVSRIKENIPNKFVSIEHLGIIQNGAEVTTGPEVEDWAGALENYSFTEVNGKTLLSVDMDANQEFRSYLMDRWPKALKKLKTICER